MVNSSYVNVYPKPESPHARATRQGTPSHYFNIGSVDSFERSLKEAQDELGVAQANRVPIVYSNQISPVSLLLNVAPTLMLVALGVYSVNMMRKTGGAGGAGGIFNVGKSKAKLFNQETDVKVTFKDIAGMDEAKIEIMEFVKFLKHPEQFERLGAKIPKGAVLSGPPGIHALFLFCTFSQPHLHNCLSFIIA